MGDKPIVESVKPNDKLLKDQVVDIDQRGLDIHYVSNKDPAFEYRWINVQKQNLETKKVRGWTPVSDKEIKTLSGSLDTTHVVGDLILCKMPKEKYLQTQKEKKSLGDQRRKVVGHRFREESQRLGVKTFDEKE